MGIGSRSAGEAATREAAEEVLTENAISCDGLSAEIPSMSESLQAEQAIAKKE
jgi:hypothetical protein